MLIPGKLYKCNIAGELDFFVLVKDVDKYKRDANSFKRITVFKSTVHLFLGYSDVLYHLGLRRNELVFLVYGKYIISRYSGPENVKFYVPIN